MNNSMQMTGLCRFSYKFKGNTGFLRPISSFDSDQEFERMEKRLWFFENITAPGLAAQTDKDFSVVVLIGLGLHERHKKRVEKVASEIGNIQVCPEIEGQEHIELCTRLIKSRREVSRQFYGEFRMDDDDAISVDFIEKSRHFFETFQKILRPRGFIELDFCSGIAVRNVDRYVSAARIVAAHWTPAQLFVFGSQSKMSLFNFNHFKFWRRHISISIPGDPMFVRGVSDYNDSVVSLVFEPLDDAISSELIRRFNIRF